MSRKNGAPGRAKITDRTQHAAPFILTRVTQQMAVLCALGAISASLPVLAQTAPAGAVATTNTPARQTSEEVVVTGTLIRGTNPVGTPVIGLGRDEINKSGAASTTDLLRQLPQIQNLGADEGHTNAAQNANQNVTAGSGINLRGLGPESTLTLLNGRRIAPGGVAGQYTDPSSIPPLAIERLEVITDGASATYGSDAVGGVVNIRLRKNFEGAEATMRYGAGDGVHQTQVGAIFGKSWDTGHFMFALDQNNRTALSADDRNFYTDNMRAFGGPDLRSVNASPGNILIGTTRYAIPTGQNGIGIAPGRLVAGTANLQSITKGISALPQQKRNSGLFALSQSLSDKITFTLDGFWTERKFLKQLVAYNGNYTVTSANPFFVSPTGATSETINYSFFNDLGTAPSSGFERSQQISAGLDFELPKDWSASAYISNSVTQERNLAPSINNNAVNAALADTNPATALNLFCDGNIYACNNPATLAKFSGYSDRNSKYTLNDTAVKADGPLFALPAGLVRLAVGAEYHSDKLPYYLLSNNTTANTSITKYVDNSSVNPRRSVRSVFAEAYIPLIGSANAMPGIERLELSISGRAENYSDFGSTSNPKVGINWVPAKGLELHSTYSTAFRAPTLGDLDPVNGSAVNPVNLIDANGTTTLRGIQYLGGNPNGLKPETATIYTFGVSFKPAALPGLSTTLDYFNIDYKNRILTPGNDPSVLQKPELAAYVNRNPTAAQIIAALNNAVYSGSTTEAISNFKFIVDGRRYNAGVVKTSGLDLMTRYVWETSFGTWNTGLSANYIFNYKQQFTPTTALVSGLLNTLNNPMRFRARGELGWTSGAWFVNSFLNYTNRYHNTTLASNPNVASYTTVDLTARYAFSHQFSGDWMKGLGATLAVQNLTDRNPPYVQNATLAFDPQNVSAIGRFISLSIDKQW